TAVLYEAPQRVARLIADLAELTGPDRRVALARELTKLHEEVFRGTLADAAARLEEREARGEFVVVLDGRGEAPQGAGRDAAEARTLAEALLAQGVAPSAAAREWRDRLGLSRNDAYQIAQEAAAGTGDAEG